MTQSLNYSSTPLLSYSIFNYSITQLNKYPTTQLLNYSIASTLILNDSSTWSLNPSAYTSKTSYNCIMSCSRLFAHTPFNSLQASSHGACRISRAAHSIKPFAAHRKRANASAIHEKNSTPLRRRSYKRLQHAADCGKVDTNTNSRETSGSSQHGAVRCTCDF